MCQYRWTAVAQELEVGVSTSHKVFGLIHSYSGLHTKEILSSGNTNPWIPPDVFISVWLYPWKLDKVLR